MQLCGEVDARAGAGAEVDVRQHEADVGKVGGKSNGLVHACGFDDRVAHAHQEVAVVLAQVGVILDQQHEGTGQLRGGAEGQAQANLRADVAVAEFQVAACASGHVVDHGQAHA